MTAKRVGSAYKTEPAIVAAIESWSEDKIVKRAEALAAALNARFPGEDHDVESVLYAAIIAGLDHIESLERKFNP